jgi:hypothetical protein
VSKTKHQNAPNAEQTQQFDEFIKHWQDVLGLGRWRLERGSKPAKDAMASVEFNDEAKLATYRIGDFGATPINEKSLCMTALHEVLHVFLHELIVTAQDRGATPEQLDAAEHGVINVLESVLWGDVHGVPQQEEG